MRVLEVALGILCLLATGGMAAAGEGASPAESASPVESASPEEVVAKVREAAALMEVDGAAALAAIGDPSSRFTWKDTYVFVVDCEKDRVMANAAFPERVGGDILRHTDYAGFRYGPVLCEVAGRPGGGWIEYVWLRPGRETPERKISFVMSVSGGLYQVGAGVYDDTVTLEALNERTRGLGGQPD